MRTKSKVTAYVLRSSAAALLVSCVIVALSSAINLPNKSRKPSAPQNNAAIGVNAQESASSAAAPAMQTARMLTFADRVAYQRVIEEVYWQHRIWPAANAGAKPPLDKVMSQAQIEKKVEDYLRESQLLEDYWQRPITPNQLQAEMERIASHTKQPEVLRELFAALGNDPFVIAECLARPGLTERLVTESKNEDRVKLTRIAWQKQPLQSRVAKIEAQLPVTMAAVSANYTLPVIASPSDSWSPSVACTDTWTSTSTTAAPTARIFHTAVWTGSEMIVWGGDDGIYSNTGGRYNPTTDSWTATTIANAPSVREQHTAVWTGSEMIVWGGGSYLNTGGRYNPSTDSWTATSTTNAPAGRYYHTAVWTGSEMIVWGGAGLPSFLNTGGRYNPSTDSWTATSIANAPSVRDLHTAVWTGSEMIIWGGDGSALVPLDTGGRYDPSTDSWTTTSTIGAPGARRHHTAVWTGAQMIVWGGDTCVNTGGRYNPSTDSWTATSTISAPNGRYYDTAVWTSSEMIVWGGESCGYPPNYLNTGGKYNPGTDSWIATSTAGAPAGRYLHTAVWTGSQMIVWGGLLSGPTYLNTGGRYCPDVPSPTVVLYDQYNDAGTSATVSATFTDSPSHNSDLADDFVVPGGQTWNVLSIDADGTYGSFNGPANSFNVFFYSDNGSLPGTQIYSATNQTWTQVGSTFTVNLPSPAVLAPGEYWVEIQANMIFGAGGEWYWTDRTVQSNNPAAWQNPGGGFGLCPSWSRRGATCNIDAPEPDQVYRLSGTIGGPLPTPTATSTPTPTATYTPTPTPTPCADSGIIVNGGFESGSFPPWVIDGINNSPVVTNTRHHSGSYCAFAGGNPPGSFCGSDTTPKGDSSFYQQFTVPAGGGTLSFWHWDCATDHSISSQAAYITNTSSTILQTIFHQHSNGQAWINQTVNMAPYAGQTVRIKFLVNQLGGVGLTGMYVDDVQLLVPCGPSPTPTVTVTPTPTLTPRPARSYPPRASPPPRS